MPAGVAVQVDLCRAGGGIREQQNHVGEAVGGRIGAEAGGHPRVAGSDFSVIGQRSEIIGKGVCPGNWDACC